MGSAIVAFTVGSAVTVVGKSVGCAVGILVGAVVQASYMPKSSHIRLSFPTLHEPSSHFVQC